MSVRICQKFQMVTSLKLLMPSLMKSLTSNIFQHQPMIYLKSKFLRKSLITFQITSRLIGLMMNLIIVRSILKRSRSMIRLIWLRCKNILVPFQKVISSKIVMTVSRKTIMSLSLLMSLRLRTLKPISITFCFR